MLKKNIVHFFSLLYCRYQRNKQTQIQFLNYVDLIRNNLSDQIRTNCEFHGRQDKWILIEKVILCKERNLFAVIFHLSLKLLTKFALEFIHPRVLYKLLQIFFVEYITQVTFKLMVRRTNLPRIVGIRNIFVRHLMQ